MKGSLRRRGKTSWELKFDVGRDDSGKRVTKYRTVRGTKREAQAELSRLLHELNTGQFVEPTKMTVAEYLRWWLDNDACHKTSAKTLQVYRYIVEKHIIPSLGSHCLARLQPLHIQDYYSEKLTCGRVNGRGGLSAQSVRHHDRLLHVALKKARRLKLIHTNPAEDVDRPKVPARSVEVLDDKDAAALLNGARGTDLYGPIFMGFTTGLRRGEIMGIEWRDVDLDRGEITVRQSLEQTKGGLRLKEPKTKRSRRLVALPRATIDMLREHRREQAERHLAGGLGKPEMVFTSPEGGYWPPDKLSRQFGLLAWKSHHGRCIGSGNLRKLFCENDLSDSKRRSDANTVYFGTASFRRV